ncbi:glycosyltransferase [Naasia aerilata]|uniref:Glycosyltransferase 2-like domain-containing protein n=1 Tax=Naasia aerilata TaxID=1162966 RepID=A0ABN6XWJ6_9MICO|nr:glycosyltransferase [Naasia aerilata]BDZ47753.1 hypothetical protein GCM10025866_36620 [Naasia aerilata]
MSTYSAVVLYYRHGPAVAETLRHLLAQTLPPTEVVVVDNCSSDGVLDALASEFPLCRSSRFPRMRAMAEE